MSEHNRFDEVWVADLTPRDELYGRPGIREKRYGYDWAPPDFSLSNGSYGKDDHYSAFRLHKKGETLSREQLTEAMYVFDQKHWRRLKGWFSADGFYAVKGKLADVFENAYLGERGGLVEFPIYEADKQTQLPGPFYFINFDGPKDTLVVDACKRLRVRRTVEIHGFELWKAPLGQLEDFELTLSADALSGTEIWIENRLQNRVFMSGRLKNSIEAAETGIDFQFSRVRIAGEGE